MFQIHIQCWLICSVSTGPTNTVFSPHKLAKNLTPRLLKTRKRFETMSAGSATTDTEGGISPLWECEEVCDCKPM